MNETTVTRRYTAPGIANSLAWLTAVLAALSAIAGLFVPGLYRDTEGWIRQARAADFMTLLAVIPILVICLSRGMTGGRRLMALSALAYLVYTYAIFGFSVAINALTPVHFAVLGLSTWALLLNVVAVSRDTQASGGIRLPRRATAFFLVGVSLLFSVMWLGQIAGAITTGDVSDELAALGLSTNPVYTLDLAFALPLLALAGVLLVRRWPRAAELGLAAVGWVVLMGLGVLAIFAFDATAGVLVPLGVAGVIGVITAIGITLGTLALVADRQRGEAIVRPSFPTAVTHP